MKEHFSEFDRNHSLSGLVTSLKMVFPNAPNLQMRGIEAQRSQKSWPQSYQQRNGLTYFHYFPHVVSSHRAC